MIDSLKPTESNQPPAIDYRQIERSLHQVFLADTEAVADTEFTSPEQLTQALASYDRNYHLALSSPSYAQEILLNPELACKRSQMLYSCRRIADYHRQSVEAYNQIMGQISEDLNSGGDMEVACQELATTKLYCDGITNVFRLYSSAHSQFRQADQEAVAAGLGPAAIIQPPYELYEQYPFPLTDVILDQPD